MTVLCDTAQSALYVAEVIAHYKRDIISNIPITNVLHASLCQMSIQEL